MKLRFTACVIFSLIFAGLFLQVQEVLQAKWNKADSNSWVRVKQFYKERQPVDVYFIGTSHVHYTVNPLLLYRNYGISGYNFSVATQDVTMAKLYVQEIIKKKLPQVIVLEGSMLVNYLSPEVNTRKGLDPLPFTIEKAQTIDDIIKEDKKHNLKRGYDTRLSYVFPILRFHDRWKDLQEEDFIYSEKVSKYHGYTPFFNTVKADFSRYNNFVNVNNVLSEHKKTVDDIISLCKKHGVRVLFVKSPSGGWRQGWHNLIAAWARRYGISFVDYNDLMSELNIDINKDFSDPMSHVNDNGAIKVTTHLGRYLKEHFDLPDRRGESEFASWESDWQFYQQDKAAYFLAQEKDWNKYVQKLQNHNYQIFISSCGDVGLERFPLLATQLNKLGLTAKMGEWKGRRSYQAIIDKGSVTYERFANAPLQHETKVDGNYVRLISGDERRSRDAVIQVGSMEHAFRRRGLGIVVYDTVLGTVVDAVTFDLYDGGKAYRGG